MSNIRVATHVDIPNIVTFLKKYHENGSNLSDIPFCKDTMFSSVSYYIATSRHVVFLNKVDDEITGVLMASVEPFMFNAKRRWATDLVFVADKGGAWLLKRFISWAKAQKVDRIFMAVSTGLSIADRLYQSVGMTRTGGMYVMNLSEATP